MSASPTRRLDKLTSLRFFAALLVVLFHLRVDLRQQHGVLQGLYMQAFSYGFVGVSIFYVLSGFVISLANDHWAGWKRYLIGRVTRIYPSHLIVTAILVLGWIVMRYHLDMMNDWRIDLANLSLVQAWIPDPQFYLSLNAVSWSLSVEVFFYAAFLLLRRLDDRAIYMSFGLSYAVLLAFLLSQHDWADPYWSFYINPIARLPEFLGGMALYRLYRGGLLDELRLPRPDFLFLLVLMMATITFLGHRGLDVIFFYSVLPLPFCMLIMLSLLREGANVYMDNRMLILLGEASFALYLIHHPLIDVVNLVARRLPGLNVFLVNGVALLLCISLAVAFHVFIEAPATGRLKQFLTGGR